jgi:hypothetical protein
MFLKERDGAPIEIVHSNSFALRTIVGIAMFLTVLSIFWAGSVLDVVSAAVQASGF